MILKANPQASESQIAGKQLRLNYSARTFLHFVCEPGSIVPVFVKESKVGSSRQLVGFYDTDHLEKLSQDVQQYSGQATGIFYGLNPVRPSCLDRAKNCLKPGWEANAAENTDVLRRRMMLIDIDTVRESDCSATNEEKDVAFWLGRIVCRDLRKAGWPRPIVVDSGNGFHLLYRVDLPVKDDELIKNCLRALASRYDCDYAKIDTTVFDPKRLAKLPGTMACKGISSAERPHRMSGNFPPPSEFRAVPEGLLCELASQAPQKSEPAAVPLQSSIQIGDKTKQIANARAYLEKMPPAIEEQHGSNQFLNAACRLVDDFALTDEQARPLLDEYNERCVPPFDRHEVQHKLDSALQKVAERGGPSGRLRLGASGANSVKKSIAEVSFHGYVPDFGYAAFGKVMYSVSSNVFSGYWVWYWLLWRSLRSGVNVPDIMLRQWHWGADYDKNWKARLRKKVGLKLVKKPECSADTCMLHGTGVRHDHYSFWPDKYHLLDSFCSPQERQPGHLRTFDVYGPQHKKLRETLQGQGTLFNVYWPALVLGSSRKVGWSWPQQRLVVGMVLELTRTRRKAGEDIAGEIISGGLVAASNNRAHETYCDLLDPEQEYMAFAGNKDRKGRGYQLVGRTGKGWIYRAGYLDAPEMNAKERLDGIKSFLKDLEVISEDLGLIPAAISHGKWKNLDQMMDCTRTGRGLEWLEGCTMRIYTPADWRHRWRQFFSDKLGFDWIPASPDDTDISCEAAQPRDPQKMTSSNQLRRWLKEEMWTQQRLANEIENVTGKACSVRRVQRHLSGESQTETFFKEVDQVREKHEEATHAVTNQA